MGFGVIISVFSVFCFDWLVLTLVFLGLDLGVTFFRGTFLVFLALVLGVALTGVGSELNKSRISSAIEASMEIAKEKEEAERKAAEEVQMEVVTFVDEELERLLIE